MSMMMVDMKRHQQMGEILQILLQEGLTSDQIEAKLKFPINRRTLQRRLKELKENHLLVTKGDARSVRYLRLHEGNFARFRIRPSEFSNWKHNWGSDSIRK